MSTAIISTDIAISCDAIVRRSEMRFDFLGAPLAIRQAGRCRLYPSLPQGECRHDAR
ncbi:hypothetical protein [Halomonas caseinilytica]|uniref:Uncharacterized protein n=1 Tax=Halomonas caseinilytica TaxID=438744 RepID=A0A1M7AZP1_9GAMM|nr:hypothetical protein [Halomonas caseinilytica]SEM11633.1 hypothetical protein SAMN04487952_101450 [Halomonas caseinilytica]SHL48076.1 hypothetical protein SAMN05192556_11713 [Halomonas caseinilytica]